MATGMSSKLAFNHTNRWSRDESFGLAGDIAANGRGRIWRNCSAALRRPQVSRGDLTVPDLRPGPAGRAPRNLFSVTDAGDVRRVALSLPHVVEIDSDGFDFRVAGKGFVWSYPERTPGKPRRIRTDIAVLFVGDEAEKQALLLGEPEIFFTTPGYDGLPLVMLRLARVDIDRLRELVTDAWRMRAESHPDLSNVASNSPDL
jgi:hypothetical protein